MSLKRTYLLIAMLFLSSCGGYAQQTIQFSQYVVNGLAVNPAYAGYKDNWNLDLSYRMQWTGFEGSPKTGTFSVDGLTDGQNKNTGIGLLLTSDKIGPQRTTSAFVNYAYRIRLNDDDSKRLSFGIGVGALQYSLDATLFKPNTVFDNSIPVNSERKIAPDARFGIYYYSPKMYVGLSAMNVLSSVQNSSFNTFALQQVHYYFTAGMLFPINENIGLKPSFLVKEDFKGPTNIDFTNFISFNNRIWLGASWRTGILVWNKNGLENALDRKDAVAAIVQVYLNDRYRVGYSYDFTISRLANYQNGSHEISIGFSLLRKEVKMLTPRYF